MTDILCYYKRERDRVWEWRSEKNTNLFKLIFRKHIKKCNTRWHTTCIMTRVSAYRYYLFLFNFFYITIRIIYMTGVPLCIIFLWLKKKKTKRKHISVAQIAVRPPWRSISHLIKNSTPFNPFFCGFHRSPHCCHIVLILRSSTYAPDPAHPRIRSGNTISLVYKTLIKPVNGIQNPVYNLPIFPHSEHVNNNIL